MKHLDSTSSIDLYHSPITSPLNCRDLDRGLALALLIYPIHRLSYVLPVTTYAPRKAQPPTVVDVQISSRRSIRRRRKAYFNSHPASPHIR